MKAFIIHLSRIPASLNTASKVKESLDEFGIENELFEGSYGNEVKKLFEETGRTCHPHSFKGADFRYTEEEKLSLSAPGVMGCFYSHFRLWQKCVELNEPIMVFEDDVMFTRTYHPVEFDDVLITVFGNRNKSAKYYHYLTDPVGEPRAEGYWQASMPGTVGYAIKPQAAKKLVDYYNEYNTFLPSDNAMMTALIKIQVHSYIMGRAMHSEDGKKSLVRGKKDFWGTFNG
jgi:GR25 family glycosyltransferase involved in LPS biosynthesis